MVQLMLQVAAVVVECGVRRDHLDQVVMGEAAVLAAMGEVHPPMVNQVGAQTARPELVAVVEAVMAAQGFNRVLGIAAQVAEV
jgi:hypothetical protein